MTDRKMTQTKPSAASRAPWYPISYALSLMLRRKRLLGLSLLLFVATVVLTGVGFQLSTEFIDQYIGGFLQTPPSNETMWGWIQHKSWIAGKWLFLIVTRIAAFYLAFLLAYCLTSPGYVFLSLASEKLHSGDNFMADDGLTLIGIFIDILEAVKIGLFGVLITIVALAINFIPLIGQAAVFLIYVFYSALMFVDYPSSRHRWSLGRKMRWIRQHSSQSFKIGLLPALVSMIPVLNIFLLSMLFPLITIYATLNFSSIELHYRKNGAAHGRNPANGN